jgi:hypothetical protein
VDAPHATARLLVCGRVLVEADYGACSECDCEGCVDHHRWVAPFDPRALRLTQWLPNAQALSLRMSAPFVVDALATLPIPLSALRLCDWPSNAPSTAAAHAPHWGTLQYLRVSWRMNGDRSFRELCEGARRAPNLTHLHLAPGSGVSVRPLEQLLSDPLCPLQSVALPTDDRAVRLLEAIRGSARSAAVDVQFSGWASDAAFAALRRLIRWRPGRILRIGGHQRRAQWLVRRLLSLSLPRARSLFSPARSGLCPCLYPCLCPCLVLDRLRSGAVPWSVLSVLCAV